MQLHNEYTIDQMVTIYLDAFTAFMASFTLAILSFSTYVVSRSDRQWQLCNIILTKLITVAWIQDVITSWGGSTKQHLDAIGAMVHLDINHAVTLTQEKDTW